MSEKKQSPSNNELAEVRTNLAKERNSLAESRTLQAAERTYAAWIRTGFTIAGAGWTLGTALSNTDRNATGLILGGILILLGVLSFIYAWVGYKAVYDYLKKQFQGKVKKNYPSTLNVTVVTIISSVLILVFAAGFVLLLID